MADQLLSPPKGLDKPIAMPFTRLENGTWLHDRPPIDVYRLLLEAYRLRMEDNYTMEGDVDDDGLYGGAPDGLPGFRRFLRLASSREGLLPPWWNAESQRECERFGMDESQYQNLTCAVEKSDILEHYGDARFPMQLRMFAEAVYRCGPGGQSGAPTRGLMVAMEQGNVPRGAVTTTIDNRTGNTSSMRAGGRN
jgi:splicing suppressor protein 51